MESQSFFEKIFLYGIVIATIFMIALISYNVSINIGCNDFTAKVVFVIVFIFGASLYSLIKLILTDMLNFLFRKKNKVKQNIEVINKVKLNDNEKFSKLFDKKHQEKAKTEKQKLEIAIQYTKEKFALYTTKEDLIKLCEYIEIYSSQGNLNAITPIQVKELKYFDVYHFGWNIWNYFNTPNNSIRRIKMAEFLKHTFKELLKNVDVEGVKSHLKTDPKKGIIKIEEDITNLTEHNQSA